MPIYKVVGTDFEIMIPTREVADDSLMVAALPFVRLTARYPNNASFHLVGRFLSEGAEDRALISTLEVADRIAGPRDILSVHQENCKTRSEIRREELAHVCDWLEAHGHPQAGRAAWQALKYDGVYS